MDYFPLKKKKKQLISTINSQITCPDTLLPLTPHLQPLPDNSVPTPCNSSYLCSQLLSLQGRHTNMHACLLNMVGSSNCKSMEGLYTKEKKCSMFVQFPTQIMGKMGHDELLHITDVNTLQLLKQTGPDLACSPDTRWWVIRQCKEEAGKCVCHARISQLKSLSRGSCPCETCNSFSHTPILCFPDTERKTRS